MLDFKYYLRDSELTHNKLVRYNGITWLTNFNNEKLPIYEKAIDIYNDDNLFIVNNGYDSYGRLVDNTSSLHVRERNDLSKFWRIVDELSK